MTPERFKEIKARCEAADGFTKLPSPETALPIIDLYCIMNYDLPDCLDEIERLKDILKRIRDDKGGNVWYTFSFNPKKAIDKVLEE